MSGKGDRNRTADFRAFREGMERVFGRAMAEKADREILGDKPIPPYGPCKSEGIYRWCHKEPGHDGRCLLRNYPPLA